MNAHSMSPSPACHRREGPPGRPACPSSSRFCAHQLARIAHPFWRLPRSASELLLMHAAFREGRREGAGCLAQVSGIFQDSRNRATMLVSFPARIRGLHPSALWRLSLLERRGTLVRQSTPMRPRPPAKALTRL